MLLDVSGLPGAGPIRKIRTEKFAFSVWISCGSKENERKTIVG
jgi:hypothetical protein